MLKVKREIKTKGKNCE